VARVIRTVAERKARNRACRTLKHGSVIWYAQDAVVEGVLCRAELRVKDARGIECLFVCIRTPLHRGYHAASLGPVEYLPDLRLKWPCRESMADQVR
jgi:hypothetical protein